MKLIFPLIKVFIISVDFSISVSTFHVPKQILLSWINFFTHACSQRCENSWVFFIASRWRCNDPCSLIWHCTRAIQCVTYDRWPSIHTILHFIHVIESSYIGCWLPNTTLSFYLGFGLAMNRKAYRKLPFMNFSFLLLHIYLTPIPIW